MTTEYHTTEHEKFIYEEADHSEETRGLHDDALIGRGVRRNAHKGVMLSFRMAEEDAKELTRLAERLDVPVSSLVRGWVTAGMRQHSEDMTQVHTQVHDVVERLAAEIERLRKIL